MIEFYWLERSSKMAVFMGPYKSADEAKQEALNWKNGGGIMTPEHAHIFLSKITNGMADLYKENGNVVTLGQLLW